MPHRLKFRHVGGAEFSRVHYPRRSLVLLYNAEEDSRCRTRTNIGSEGLRFLTNASPRIIHLGSSPHMQCRFRTSASITDESMCRFSRYCSLAGESESEASWISTKMFPSSESSWFTCSEFSDGTPQASLPRAQRDDAENEVAMPSIRELLCSSSVKMAQVSVVVRIFLLSDRSKHRSRALHVEISRKSTRKHVEIQRKYRFGRKRMSIGNSPALRRARP